MAFAIYFMIAQATSIKELLIFIVYTLKYFTHFVLNFCRQSKVNSKSEGEQTIINMIFKSSFCFVLYKVTFIPGEEGYDGND
jgi:hypothetical protein